MNHDNAHKFIWRHDDDDGFTMLGRRRDRDRPSDARTTTDDSSKNLLPTSTSSLLGTSNPNLESTSYSREERQ
jgi:hypothetical protein